MLPTPCHVISDVHLGIAAPEAEATLLRYLRALPQMAASLVVNGDLFDFWFEWRQVIPRGGFRVLAELARLRELGVPVLWIAGNHDCWGGEVLREDVGADYREGPWEGRVGPWRTRFEHGDGLRPERDRAYRRLRTVIRHPWAVRAFRWLHPDVGSAIASGSSHASRTHRPGDEGRELQEIALETLARRPDLDLVVFGHSHATSLTRAAGGGVYANPGSWLEAPACLILDDARISLARLDEDGRPSAERHALDLLDRRAEEAAAEGEHLLGRVGRDEAVRHRRP